MKKLVVLAAFSAFAVAAHSAAACDWDREASASDQAVGASEQAPPATPTCDDANCPTPQPTSVASQETRQTVNKPAPIVLITDRH
jgi:hypothetical protein